MKGSFPMNSDFHIHVSIEPVLLTLDSPDAALELVGGKGASLARLAAADLPALLAMRG
jgi:hypothetical protein